jgi:hypothetical protein
MGETFSGCTVRIFRSVDRRAAGTGNPSQLIDEDILYR